jgi:glycosyltransferase involved in cell wall biosynthesis
MEMSEAKETSAHANSADAGASHGQPPLVSVCIPVYNCNMHIGEAIESVLSQTFRDFELVICDDCSTDDTRSIIERYRDPRIRSVPNEVNLGMVGNWNRVMSLGRGKYIKLLCADDGLYPNCLSRQVEILEDPSRQDILMVFTRRDIIGPDSKRILTHGFSGKSGRYNGIDVLRRSIRSGTNMVGEPGGVLVRASILPSAGEYSGEIPWVVDLDLWSRILALGDVYAIHEPLWAFRVAKVSLSIDIVPSQACYFRAFIAKLRKDPRFGVTRLDAVIGSAKAELNRRLRQIFYRYILR